ncbi:hypothetical protein EMPG_10704 [Blastomyces silverae]|uniref:Uncharacterized protein n=1 Tax=Blastomyces silverae TaxID=2060906 RepID=A0A0H1B3B4_9EURO|nr:hypothetical protein EMPG_10704 [Blastomyces silverae]
MTLIFISIINTQITDLHRFFNKFYNIIIKLKSLKISIMNIYIFNIFYFTFLIN